MCADFKSMDKIGSTRKPAPKLTLGFCRNKIMKWGNFCSRAKLPTTMLPNSTSSHFQPVRWNFEISWLLHSGVWLLEVNDRVGEGIWLRDIRPNLSQMRLRRVIQQLLAIVKYKAESFSGFGPSVYPVQIFMGTSFSPSLWKPRSMCFALNYIFLKI